MMAPGLDELPQEIVNGILSSLSVHDCCNLRLVNRVLQWKAIRRSFRDSFRRKSLEINQQNLESFVAVTQSGRLGCLIQDLSLCGLLIDYERLTNAVTKGTRTREQMSGFITLTCEDPLTFAERFKARSDLEYLSNLHSSNNEMIKSQRAVTLLARALENISNNSPLQQLLRLSIEVKCIIDDPRWRHSPMQFGKTRRYTDIWPQAVETFQITMSALAESKLRVRDLIVFNSPGLEGCSLFRDQIQLLEFPKLKTLTLHLRTLSLNLLACDSSLLMSDGHRYCKEVISENDFAGLNTLVAHCTALKVLDVYYYSVKYDRNLDTGNEYNPIPTVAVGLSELGEQKSMRLELLVLAGLITREYDLLEFLKRNPCTKLVLDHIKLIEGSFRSIFDFCIDPESGLTGLEITSLHERKLIWFPGTDDDSLDLAMTSPSDPQSGTISLSRYADDILLPIEYYFPDSPLMLYSLKNYSYFRNKVQSFGPLPIGNID